MHRDQPATQVIDRVEPPPDEHVVVKRRFSACTGRDLEVLLRGLEAGPLVLDGISTSGVVLSALRQAAGLDFRLTVLQDACGDSDEEVRRVLMQKVLPRQALVTNADEWIESIAS